MRPSSGTPTKAFSLLITYLMYILFRFISIVNRGIILIERLMLREFNLYGPPISKRL